MDTIEQEELSTMVQLAIVGCMKGKVKQSRDILNLILTAYPDNIAAKTCYAFSCIVVDEFAQADSMLEDIINADSENDDAKGFLVLSKKLQGNLDIANEVFETIKDSNSCGYKLAKEALELEKKQEG